ncbi:MAG: hypothetical protein FWC41_04145 [Firmicutes bacterium]|nr:hypothetical protein [Bacillota bacterium]
MQSFSFYSFLCGTISALLAIIGFSCCLSRSNGKTNFAAIKGAYRCVVTDEAFVNIADLHRNSLIGTSTVATSPA